MSKYIITKRIILYEILGFGIVIMLLWIDEIFDLPHKLGAPPTPINWTESVFETAFVILLALAVIYKSWGYIRHMKYLEGLLPVCSFCKKIRIHENWVPIEEYVREHSDARFSHSLCPDCMSRHYSIKDEE